MPVVTNGNYLNPSPIENATVLEKLIDGVLKGYFIQPIEGYVLHDKNYDNDIIEEGTDENGNPIDIVVGVELGYRTSTTNVAANYDFVANPREFYTVLRSEVPEDNIYGGGDNDHEVM
jgi:hypothetical protein